MGHAKKKKKIRGARLVLGPLPGKPAWGGGGGRGSAGLGGGWARAAGAGGGAGWRGGGAEGLAGGGGEAPSPGKGREGHSPARMASWANAVPIQCPATIGPMRSLLLIGDDVS